MAARARNLSIRVPWHDAAWNGTFCQHPDRNVHCVEYENIAKSKHTAIEIERARASFAGFDPTDLPPCASESGAFMSTTTWTTSHEHPYRDWLKDTHGHLERTSWPVNPYTAHAVPFRWLSRRELESFTQNQLLEPLPEDTYPPEYTSDWVFQPRIQEEILAGFFAPITEGESACFMYTKARQPIAEGIARLVVAIGTVMQVGQQRYYNNHTKPGAPNHPIWERDVSHSIRPAGKGGFLIPFHEYLVATGDPDEDARRLELAQELVIVPEPQHTVEFSYRSEHVSDDATVSILTQAIRVVDRVRQHNVAEGDWAAVELWLNDQLSQAWALRGEHPGLGPVLQAAGLGMATALVYQLDATDPHFQTDPWSAVEKVLDGETAPPHSRFQKEINAFSSIWTNRLRSDAKRYALAQALSRVALDNDQAVRWWDHSKRDKATAHPISDEAITTNPYVLSEYDYGVGGAGPVRFATVDRAIIGDGSDAAGADKSAQDPHRLRAAVVATLRDAETKGDTLLGHDEIRENATALPVPTPIVIAADWIPANTGLLSGIVNVHESWSQLTWRAAIADQLKRKLAARARSKKVSRVDEDWMPLLEASIREKSPDADLKTERAKKALAEQIEALDQIVSRKLTVLVGRAGTGKTTVLGALSRSDQLGGPILFLAPTGKARVRLAKNVAEGNPVQTVAQYLWSQGAYDGASQQPVVLDEGRYDGHQTIVIDECSMLTEETLLSVLASISPAVTRVILVGDTAQLPPIGPGRPFADLVAHLSGEFTSDTDDEDSVTRVADRKGAHARLYAEVRNRQGEDSATLRFAAHFTGDPLSINAEQILSDLQNDVELNDLSVRYWATQDNLHALLVDVLHETIDLDPGDTERFNELFGIGPEGKHVNVLDPDAAETWQILSPVRANTWGVDDLNRWVQQTWRGRELHMCRTHHKWVNPFGPREIIRHDKVILTQNLRDQKGWDFDAQERVSAYLANGDIGLCANDRKKIKNKQGKAKVGAVMDIKFTGHASSIQYSFWRNQFGGETGGGIFDLAYALTIHKSQGSDFRTVIVVLPRETRINSRELLYTALTRSTDQLILLVEGDDLSPALKLKSITGSDTLRRNTNLFRTSVRNSDDRPWAHHLVHRASDGTAVRSKSEVLIMNACLEAGLKPRYEIELKSLDGKTFKLPDFTFLDDADEPVLWEHLGMLDKTIYAADWEAKKRWYTDNGYVEGENLFTTHEVGGFDTSQIAIVIEQIKQAVGAV